MRHSAISDRTAAALRCRDRVSPGFGGRTEGDGPAAGSRAAARCVRRSIAWTRLSSQPSPSLQIDASIQSPFTTRPRFGTFSVLVQTDGTSQIALRSCRCRSNSRTTPYSSHTILPRTCTASRAIRPASPEYAAPYIPSAAMSGSSPHSSLDHVAEGVEPSTDVHVILDIVSSHKSAIVNEWLKDSPNWTSQFAPGSDSGTNAVEGFFSKLSKLRHAIPQLGGRVHRSDQGPHRAPQSQRRPPVPLVQEARRSGRGMEEGGNRGCRDRHRERESDHLEIARPVTCLANAETVDWTSRQESGPVFLRVAGGGLSWRDAPSLLRKKAGGAPSRYGRPRIRQERQAGPGQPPAPAVRPNGQFPAS